MENKIILWTAQTSQVMEELAKNGINYVKEQYITEKYKEAAWSFQLAYQFLAKEAKKRISKPEEAESLIWLYKDPKWIFSGRDTTLLQLSIPADEIILFDLRKWNRILNLSLLGTPAEEAKFEQELARQGIANSSDVFANPYYPLLKKKITDSWQKLFENTDIEESYLQGACFSLKKEWIIN